MGLKTHVTVAVNNSKSNLDEWQTQKMSVAAPTMDEQENAMLAPRNLARDLYLIDMDLEPVFVRAESREEAIDKAKDYYISEAGFEPETVHSHKVVADEYSEAQLDRAFIL